MREQKLCKDSFYAFFEEKKELCFCFGYGFYLIFWHIRLQEEGKREMIYFVLMTMNNN